MLQTKQSSSIRRMLRLVIAVAALGFGIKALLLHPVYIQLASNISYRDTWYTTVLYYLIDGGLIDLAVFAVCYPATVYAIWMNGLKESRRIPVSFSLLTLARFILNYVMSCLTDTGFPDLDELWRDIPPILLMLLLELFQYAVVILATVMVKRHYENRVADADVQAEMAGTNAPAPVFPFTGLFKLQNPLQLIAFLSALVQFVLREVNYHVYQITLYRLFGSTDGWADMLFTLLGDLMLGVLLYFAAILLLSHFHSKESDPA